MEERKITIKNLKINYKIAGRGESLLILHGWGGSSDSWTKIGENLAARNYRVLIPDLPGFGKSQAPFKPWGVEGYVKWLRDFLNKLGTKKIFLVAHSFGGRIGIEFAAGFPQKLKKLILCSAPGVKFQPTLRQMMAMEVARLGNLIFKPWPLRPLKNKARNLFYFLLRQRDYLNSNEVMREVFQKVVAKNLTPYLSQIKTKTLVIWGQNDKLVPLRCGKLMAEKIPGSKLEILPKIGHSPHLECPEKLIKILISFLNSR